jgi:hypothetical protein
MSSRTRKDARGAETKNNRQLLQRKLGPH